MFFMSREYHSFTVSVRIATTRVEEHARNNSGSLGEAVATPDLSYASAGFQPASRPCACDHKGRRRAAGRDVTREAYRRRDGSGAGPAMARAQGISLRLPSARRWAARDRAERAGTPRDGRSCRQLFMHVTAVVRDQAGMAGDSRGAAAATCKIAGIAYTG